MDDTLTALQSDFKLFLQALWDQLDLPQPTRAQYAIADYLQSGPKRLQIQAFRGVGKSDGEHDGSEGELADAAIALDWLQNQNQESQDYWICGISFGAWVGMQLLMRRPEILKFVLVSPPVGKYDFNFLAPCPASGVIINADKDSLIEVSLIKDVVRRLNQQKSIDVKQEVIKSTDHFFNNHEEKVIEKVKKYCLK